MQYFIYTNGSSVEQIIIRLNDSKNAEYFDYDGSWKKCDLSKLKLCGEVQEITESQFRKIQDNNYKYYFCKKREPKLLVRIFNEIYLEIYDENSNTWKKAPNSTWLSNILYDGDSDFEEINAKDAFIYKNSIIEKNINNENNKKMTR